MSTAARLLAIGNSCTALDGLGTLRRRYAKLLVPVLGSQQARARRRLGASSYGNPRSNDNPGPRNPGLSAEFPSSEMPPSTDSAGCRDCRAAAPHERLVQRRFRSP